MACFFYEVIGTPFYYFFFFIKINIDRIKTMLPLMNTSEGDYNKIFYETLLILNEKISSGHILVNQDEATEIIIAS